MKKTVHFEQWANYKPLGRKSLLIMRLTTFLFFVSVIQVMGLEAHSQETKISLNYDNTSLKSILAVIENETNYYFLYSSAVIDANRKVSVNVDNKELTEVLDKLLKDVGIGYEIKGRQILLSSTNSLITDEKNQQPVSVSGQVKDSSGVPLPGATVIVKGTNIGTVTDSEGNFSLQRVKATDILVFSFIGMVSQEIVVGSQAKISVFLSEETIGVDEVVVVGFGTQKKVNLTGSVGIVDAETLEARPVQDAVVALQGAVPGLIVSQSSTVGATLDASPSIRVRGEGTISDDNSSDAPLVLIDGIEGDLSQLNPQDIESISLLKDASASAIYGSRAAFGVLLVTTKSGKVGKPRVTYTGNFRFQTPIRMPHMQNSYEWVNFFRDAFRNGGTSNTYDNDDYRAQILAYKNGELDVTDVFWSTDGTGAGSGGKWNYDYGNANVNWLEEYYKTWSPSQEHNLSVSGGTENVKYYVSSNYMTRDGFMRYGGDSFNRYSLSSRVDVRISDKLNIGANTRFVRTDYKRPTIMNDNFFNNLMRRARPSRPKYDPNGYLASDINYVASLTDGGRHKQQNDLLSQQITFEIKPVKDLIINADLNVRLQDYWQHYDQHPTYAHYSGLGEYSSEETYAATLTGFSNEYVSLVAK